MTREERNEVYTKIFTDPRYGLKEMRKKWVEELLELALLLQQHQNKNCIDMDQLDKEMADVYIGLEQMFVIFGNVGAVEVNVNKIVESLPKKLDL